MSQFNLVTRTFRVKAPTNWHDNRGQEMHDRVAEAIMRAGDWLAQELAAIDAELELEVGE